MKRLKRRIYGPDRDPVGRHVGEDVLGRALRELCSDAERRLLLRYLHGEPPRQLARDLGLGEGIFGMLIAGLLDRVRRSKYASALRQELSGPRFSAEVWGGAAEVSAHRCERPGCGAPPFPQRPVGRPRRFCSSACRQAAYRERLRTGAGRRLAAAGRLAGPRPARLTDYSAAPPAFPPPQALPDSGAFRNYLGKSIRRWHAPTAAEDRMPGTPVLWPASFPPHSRPTAVFDGQGRGIRLGKTVEIGWLIASSLWMRTGLLALGRPASGGIQPHGAHRVSRPRPAFLPPTPSSPMASAYPNSPGKALAVGMTRPVPLAH
ncbi:hypothetical protein [Streptomyces sp. NPDC007205]|uniref:hypothetical protein n=1 Tax=Streptomyces sp. NPDC007205 TaxID=3154316 RepID=UPI0033F79731